MGIEPEIGEDPFKMLENMEPLTEGFDIPEGQPVLEEVFIHAIQVLNQLLILNIV